MAYVVEIGSIKITCETLEELTSVVSALRAAETGGAIPPADKSRHAPHRPNAQIPAGNPSESKPLRLLRAIYTAGKHGVLNSVAATAIGINNPRGLGPVIVALRGELSRASMQQTDAMSVQSGPDGTKYFPTERTAEAIAFLASSPSA
jgi:hypothetical protein